jgi:hypothetical protein
VTVRRQEHTRPRRAAAVLLACLPLLLAACMQVPDSGPVRPGPRVGAGEEPVLRYVPLGPRRGASPLSIVNGYLDAMRAFPPNPGIAREFLTEQAAADWNPGAGVHIYSDRPDVEESGAGRVRLEADVSAVLSERGAWSPPTADEERLRRSLRLQRVRGEWRITDPPAGLLIPDFDFERWYRPYALYFFDPALRVLVPNQVYLPEGHQTATLLFRGLVRGPTESLRGAVRSLVPPSERAAVSVPVSEDGVADVQLGAAARTLGTGERALLAAQLSWTLRQVSEVETVRVTVGGAPLAFGGGDNVIGPERGARFDPADPEAADSLFALRDRSVVRVDQFGSVATPVPGLFGGGDARVRAFAVSRLGRRVGAVTGAGRTVEVAPVGAAESQVWLDGPVPLLGLQWDRHGLLWAVQRTSGVPRVLALRDGRARGVPLRGDPPADVRAFAMSRDGIRLAVVAGAGDGARLLVGRVRRPANGSGRLAVDRWREIPRDATGLSRFVDVAWASPTELTVAAREGGGSPQVFTVAIDGSAVEPANLVDLDVVAVADSPVTDIPPVLATRPGSLFVQVADRWSELALSGALRQPAYVE